MILVDTSVWIDHLRRNDEGLAKLLNDGQVMSHPFVIGEIALGSLQNRALILNALQDLPKAPVATESEALRFIEQHALAGVGIGIGYIDAHLLAAARLAPGTLLWTRDKRLLAVATRLALTTQVTH